MHFIQDVTVDSISERSPRLNTLQRSLYCIVVVLFQVITLYVRDRFMRPDHLIIVHNMSFVISSLEFRAQGDKRPAKSRHLSLPRYDFERFCQFAAVLAPAFSAHVALV